MAAVLLGNLSGRLAVLTALLAAAMALAGVFVGDLSTIAGPALGTPPFNLPERTIIAALFAIGGWLGEFAIAKIAGRGDLVADVRAIPRANLIANLLFVSPATILADVLATRGILLFVLLLVVLIVALALIALYLSAETARRGAAGERERLQSIVSQVPDGILAVRSDLTVDWLNETAGHLTGWDLEAAGGRPFADVMHAQDSDGIVVDHRKSFLQAARTGQPVHIRADLRARDGVPRQVIISYTSMPSATDGLEIGVAAVREVSDDGRETQMAALGHELRSPLTAILGYTGLMMRAAPGSLDAEHQAEFIGRIAASSDYMLRLVNNLLDLRRMESGAEPVQPTLLQIDRVLQVVMALSPAPGLREAVDHQYLDRAGPAAAHDRRASPSAHGRQPALERDQVHPVRRHDPSVGGGAQRGHRDLDHRHGYRADRRGAGEAVRALLPLEPARGAPRAWRRPRAGAGAESVRRLGGEVTVTSQVGVGSTFTVWIPPLDRAADETAASAAAPSE